MKKSEIFKLAQCAVLDSGLSNFTKLEILRELISKEDSALFWEQKEQEEKGQENAAV